MRPRGPGGGLAAAALLSLCHAGGCGGGGVRLRTAAALEGATSGGGRLRQDWAHRQLRAAALSLREAFARDGAEALLRLRLHGEEIAALYTEDGARRVARTSCGLEPSPGEQRWRMFASLARTPLVGFCARGARVVEANGPEGFRTSAFVVDRFLIVGAERGGMWGAWIEGLVLTDAGWRLLPETAFGHQVETPRRDHTDVELWDCDVEHRPRRDQPL